MLTVVTQPGVVARLSGALAQGACLDQPFAIWRVLGRIRHSGQRVWTGEYARQHGGGAMVTGEGRSIT